tara:strand:+ start:1043 stop:1384 length:342 start_codon:yes stop_codon:yes gene_type:complete
MRAFAEKAVLTSESTDGLKSYDITWIDAHGRRHLDFAQGVNMATALKTVIRTRQAERLAKMPDWVWILAYTLFMVVFSVGAVKQNAPLLLITSIIVGAVAVKLATDRYFRFVK